MNEIIGPNGTKIQRACQQDRRRRSHRLFSLFILALLVGVLGWGETAGSDRHSAHQASHQLEIRELWRFGFSDVAETQMASAAAWEDGTVWIAGYDSTGLWELNADGSSSRVVRRDVEVAQSFGSRILAFVPTTGMFFLGRSGVVLYRSRGDTGIVVDRTVRSTPRGFAGFGNGDYVVSYGQWRDDPHVEHAVHRYDGTGHHVVSWHPAFSYPQWADQEWRAVIRMSGGPLAVTTAGDLLVSDAVPFRITRYVDGFPDSAITVIENDEIVSPDEIERALPRIGTYRFGEWSPSDFVHEMADGRILNVVFVKEHSSLPFVSGRRYPRWIVVGTAGDILIDEETEYRVVAAVGRDTYLAHTRGGGLAKIVVSIELEQIGNKRVR